jgi:glycosyltransferase involved in cell wall biosynthesis
MSKRIFLHTPEPVSSPALYVDELARALTHSGLPVHVVCPQNHQALASFKSNPLITLHLTHERSTESVAGLFAKVRSNLHFLLSSCHALLRGVEPGDIIHFQYVLHFPFGALFFLCALLRRSTIAFTVHDPLPHKWLLPARFRAIEKGALAWSYRVSDVLLVHSESGKNTLVKNFPSIARKIRVIAHGPYELERPVPPPAQSDYLEVLLFGALRENKGAHLAIEAVQRLYAEGIPVRLTIAGRVLNRKEQPYWDSCRQLIGNCPGSIHLLEEFIPDNRLPELFGKCHCFLLPYTSFSSDSGVAFMALANGRPIISTKSGGLGSLLESSSGGIAIELPTATAVADALLAAVTLGGEKLEAMGRAGKAWVMEECCWPKVAQQTLEIYRECAETIHEEGNERPKQPIFS